MLVGSERPGPIPDAPIHGKAERIRHFRKYAVGDLK